MSTISRRDVCAVLAGVPLLRFHAAAAQPPVELSAGPLRMIFEPELAMLRYLRLGETEVVRGIFAPVRDRNWGTVEPRISNVKIIDRGANFRVSFDVACQAAPIDFVWKGLIVGERTGVVKFTFSGKAQSTFLRNRIGFCVLHPIDGVAGTDCTVEHTGGKIEKGRFPELISPHQPFFDIRAITHQAAPGATVEVRMEGDTFEMEDQRNWTDGSYKTYCTPLAKPFPAEVKAGTLIEQSVTVSVKGPSPKLARRGPAPPVRITIDESARHPLPDIGLGIDTSATPSAGALELLRALRLGHVRAEVRIGAPEWDQAIGRAAALARAVASELELAVIASTDDPGTEYARVGRLLRDNALRPRRLLMLHDQDASTSLASLSAGEQRVGGLLIPLGAGTRANFTELNRNRPAIDRCQFVAYPINPQVHAFDDASLVETLEIQAATLRTARTFSGQLPIVVAPVTFKQRFNPVATSAAAPPTADPRQKTRFGACWTLGSIKYLAEGGAAAAAYFDLTGDAGVVSSDRVHPLYHVFADVCDFAGGETLTARSTRKLDVECLALQKDSNRRLLIANFRPVAQPVEIAISGKWSMRRLDSSTEAAALADPTAFRATPGETIEAKNGVVALRLEPHSIVRLDRAS